jgi:hypothetical protein
MAAPARRLEPVRRPAHPGIRVSPARTRPAGARSGASTAAATARAPGKAARTIKAAPPRPQLRVVPPRVRRRRAGAIAVVVCAVTFLVMLGLTVFQARIAADQMRIEQIDRQIRDAKADYTRLRLMVAEAQTPVAAAERAKANGLIPPPKGIEAYVTPSIEQVIAVARSGAASEPGATVENAATAAPLDGTTDTNQGSAP